MGYSGRPGIGLVRIMQIKLPYHTNIRKSTTSSSVETLIPLADKVDLSNKTFREKGGTTRVRVRTHTRATFQLLWL